uniref:kelch-like protein 7 n=1 Tax=Styela clava TaxID=7725 RepID=UPI00193ACD28|nr:kelch-like protein 7 [Styela clava]
MANGRESKSRSQDLLIILEKQRLEEKYCDFIIKVGDEKIHVHRNVIAASSSYFDKMLFHNSKERKDGFVELQDVDPESVKKCVKFIYTGKVLFSTNSPEFLIHVSELFNLTELSGMYFEYLIENLDLRNCFYYKELAQKYHHVNSQKQVDKYISENFDEMTSTEDFQKKSLSEVQKYMNSLSGAHGEGEILKWKAAVKWVKADEENRTSMFLHLLHIMSLADLPKNFVNNQVQTEPLMEESKDCRAYLINVLSESIHTLKNEKNQFDITIAPVTQSAAESGFCEPVPHIVLLPKHGRMLYNINCQTSELSRITKIPREFAEGHRDVVCIDKEIYVLHKQSLIKYSSGMWKNLANLESEPSNFKCVTCNGCIFVIESEKLSKFIPETNTWVEEEEGHHLGEGVMVTASPDHIYAFGGKGTEKQAREFDGDWDRIDDMLSEHCNGGAAASCSPIKIFAVGGLLLGRSFDQYISIEFYTPSTNQWTKFRNSNDVTAFNLEAFATDNTLFVKNRDSNKMVKFDIKAKEISNSITAMKSDSGSLCFR